MKLLYLRAENSKSPTNYWGGEHAAHYLSEVDEANLHTWLDQAWNADRSSDLAYICERVAHIITTAAKQQHVDGVVIEHIQWWLVPRIVTHLYSHDIPPYAVLHNGELVLL